MNKTEYLKALGNALMNRGMTKETAEYHMRLLSMSINEKDLAERSDDDIKKEIDRLADSVTLIVKSRNDDKSKKETGEVSPQGGSVLPEYVSPDSVVPFDFDAENVPRGDEIDELVGKSKYRRIRDEKPVSPTSGGIYGASAKIVSFVALYILMILLRILCVVLLIAVTIAGVAFFAIGMVYGVSLLFSFKGAGIFEIGLSLIIGGVFVALGVILYNSAGSFIPRFQKWLTGRIRNVHSRLKEARAKFEKRRKRT